jgi:putative Ca2+/H+ antiporter (TMEM165/GDT1 family)
VCTVISAELGDRPPIMLVVIAARYDAVGNG